MNNSLFIRLLIHWFITSCLLFYAIFGQDIIINEIVSSNNSIYKDRFNEFNDWLEIKNLSSDSLNLEGFWISDDINDIFKWNIPSLVVPPNSFEVLFCSGKNILDSGSGTVWQTIIDAGAGTGAHRSTNNKSCVTISLDIKFIGSTKLGDEIVGFTKIQKVTNSLVFLICHLECKGKLIASASGIWKILKKPLPNAGFGG